MKIAYVELAGFRGFRDKTRFDFSPSFVVLSGRNGAGKSTILDALDFALTGTIDKYPVTSAKGGGLNNHMWWLGGGTSGQQYVELGFVDDDGGAHSVRRTPEGAVKSSSDLAQLLCLRAPDDWARTLVDTTLIRDETITKLSMDLPEQARFEAVRSAIGALTGSDRSYRTQAILDQAKGQVTASEASLQVLRRDLSRLLTALTEARSAADREADVAEAEKLIASLAPDINVASTDVMEKMRRRVADRKQSHSTQLQMVDLATRQLDMAATTATKEWQDNFASVAKTVDNLRGQHDQALEESRLALEAELAQQDADEFASQMVALLSHGEHIGLIDGHCPLCAAERSNSEFAAAIAAARTRLSDQGRRAFEARDKRIASSAKVADIARQLVEAEARLASLSDVRDENAKDLEELTAALKQQGLADGIVDPESMRAGLLRQQEDTAQLEHALFILETSAAHDRVTALSARVDEARRLLEEEEARSVAREGALETAKRMDTAAKTIANQIINEQFDTVMPLLKELYARLRPHGDWREIETDFGGKIRATLNFTVGDGRNPQFLFSSGQRRAAGLAFLLTIHLSRSWAKLRTLMLDDPVQHIDDYRALNLVEVLSAVRRQHRQIVVAVEDPLLADLLCRRLRSASGHPGRRFDLAVDKSGSAAVETVTEIAPLASGVLKYQQAS